MSTARVISKATYLPDLEDPIPAKNENQFTKRLTVYWEGITGLGEGSISLARLSRGTQFAVFSTSILALLFYLS